MRHQIANEAGIPGNAEEVLGSEDLVFFEEAGDVKDRRAFGDGPFAVVDFAAGDFGEDGVGGGFFEKRIFTGLELGLGVGEAEGPGLEGRTKEAGVFEDLANAESGRAAGDLNHDLAVERNERLTEGEPDERGGGEEQKDDESEELFQISSKESR